MRCEIFRMYLYAGKLPGSRQGLVRVFPSHFPIKGFHPPHSLSDCLQVWLTTAIPSSSPRILVRALSTSLEYNEPVSHSTVAMVKLWHVIYGLYMCVCQCPAALLAGFT